MLPLWALMAIAGAAKSEVIDKPKEQRDRKLAAETIRWSPWTGMHPGPIQQADPAGSAVNWGLMGAQLGQSQANSAAYNDYLKRTGMGGQALPPNAGMGQMVIGPDGQYMQQGPVQQNGMF